MARGKKYKETLTKVDKNNTFFSGKDAIGKIIELSFVKFNQSLDIDINLNIDAAKGDQVVRGSVVLPNFSGEKKKIAVFAKGEQAVKAKAAGADYVGDDDLIEKIAGGWIDFHYTVSETSMMGSVGKLAKILGSKGLLPNKKLGTVVDDVEFVVNDLLKGKKFFKNDKYGIIHFSLGKINLGIEKLYENFITFVKKLNSSRPAALKGKFIKKITLSSTMGIGLKVNLNELF